MDLTPNPIVVPMTVASNMQEVSLEPSAVVLPMPKKTSDLINDGANGTSTYVEASALASVATSGSYNDLTNKPTDANGIVPIANGGTGIDGGTTDDWYENTLLHPHFVIVYDPDDSGFSGRYLGPTDGISDVSSALASSAVQQALHSVVPIRLGNVNGNIIGTATIMSGAFIGSPSTLYILYPDSVSFGGNIVNGMRASLAWDSSDLLLYFTSLVPSQPYWYTTWRPSLFFDGLDGEGQLGPSRTLDTLYQSNGVIYASATDIAITSNKVTANSTAATIATGDTLIIGDSSASNTLAKTSISFDTTNSTQFLRKDGTWAIPGNVILSYGSSTWQDFIDAYNANRVIYCRASSNTDPSSGSQTRMAFMAYVNNETTPTYVEFQYYRSVAVYNNNQQGDEVYVYKLTNADEWTVTKRQAYTKIVAGTNMSSSYKNGTLTLSAGYFGVCNTAAADAAKVVTCEGFVLKAGVRISVRFTTGSTSTSVMSLNVNNTGAKNCGIYLYNKDWQTYANRCEKNEILEFMYDGTYWITLTPYALRNYCNYNSRFSSADISWANGGLQYFLATSSMTTGKPPIDAAILNMNWDNGTIWGHQLAVGNGAGRVFSRAQTGDAVGSWSAWKEIPRLSSSLTDGQIVLSDESTGTALLKGGPAIDTTDTTKFLRHDGTWQVPSAGLPSVTSADNGKVLMVVNGAWAVASLPLYDGSVT